MGAVVMEIGQQFAGIYDEDPDVRITARQALAKADKEYGKAYRRGRQASVRYGMSSGGGYGKTPLEKADDRGEPEAWYHGYEDHASWG